MKTFKQLKEENKNTIIVAFGRFQGIHVGHEELVNSVIQTARNRNADHLIFPSTSQDNKKNPIPFDKKVEFLQQIFPYANFNTNPQINQIFKIIPYVSKTLGYNKIILLAGEDRVEEWKGKLNKYLTGDYPLDLEIEPTGLSRSFSGTEVRNIVKNNDFNKFLEVMPNSISNNLAREIFTIMKQNLKG